MMINTEPVTEDRLAPRLMEVFKTRAERVVFVKGDPDVEFQNVARAIDIAKGFVGEIAGGTGKDGKVTAKTVPSPCK